MRDSSTALGTMAREEPGLNPTDLGSPVAAALSSFLMFAVGAVIPVVPFVFLGEMAAVFVAAAAGALALLVVGAGVSRVTGRSMLTSAVRMLVIGGAAAVVTYAVGSALGVSVE
jgi:predicted membrane protein (TIGR00267 family)